MSRTLQMVNMYLLVLWTANTDCLPLNMMDLYRDHSDQSMWNLIHHILIRNTVYFPLCLHFAMEILLDHILHLGRKIVGWVANYMKLKIFEHETHLKENIIDYSRCNPYLNLITFSYFNPIYLSGICVGPEWLRYRSYNPGGAYRSLIRNSVYMILRI